MTAFDDALADIERSAKREVRHRLRSGVGAVLRVMARGDGFTSFERSFRLKLPGDLDGAIGLLKTMRVSLKAEKSGHAVSMLYSATYWLLALRWLRRNWRATK